MSEKALRRVAVLLVALLAVYLIVRIAGLIGGRHADSGGSVGAAVHRLNVDTVVTVSIAGPKGEAIVLQHAGTGWTANGYPADTVTVGRFLAAAASAKLGPLVARSAATHAVLGLTDSAAWKLTVRGGHDSASLLLGFPATEEAGVYVRVPGRDTAYEVLGNLRGVVANPITVWRDRVIAQVDSTALNRIVIDRNQQRYVVERGDKGWRDAATRDTASLEHVAALLSELRRLQAIGFAGDSARPKGTETRRIVALGLKGDTLLALDLVGGAPAWLVRARGNPQRYVVSQFDADRLIPLRSEMFPSSKGH